MSRPVIAWAAACAVACAGAVAAAQPAGEEPRPASPSETPPVDSPPPSETPPPLVPVPAPRPARPAPEPPDEIGDQLIGGTIGVAAGGRTTPGGLHVTGHYLYQLSEQDWFDGIAGFTFGGGDAACFRDRSDTLLCDHDLAEGGSIELALGVRRMFLPQGRFRPFARVAVGGALVRFGGDDVSGAALVGHAGAGLRASVAPGVAVIALADVMLGVGAFSRGVGGEPQLGLAVTAGAEVRLR